MGEVCGKEKMDVERIERRREEKRGEERREEERYHVERRGRIVKHYGWYRSMQTFQVQL